jgi:hypothetical protein
MGVADEVMNITEVRERLREVREEALYRGVIVRWGDRGRDELVTLSRELFQRLTDRPAGASAGPPADAWAAFEAALVEGRLSDSGEHGLRRREPGLRQTSSVAWNDIPAAAGTDPRAPRRRVAE